MTPFDDFAYLVNVLGDDPTIEDFILLIGTLVAFVAFLLWCCFPIQPKETSAHRQFCGKMQTSDAQLQQSSNYTKTMPIDYGIKNGHHCYS